VVIVFFPMYVTFIGSTQTAQQIQTSNPISLLPGNNFIESYRFALFGGKTEAGASVAPAAPMMGSAWSAR
jgi:sn-glycerol 3-phosphate transport system permease protein